MNEQENSRSVAAAGAVPGEGQPLSRLDFARLVDGPTLEPGRPRSDAEAQVFAGWDTPLAPWGAFNLPSGLAVVRDGGRAVLELCPGGRAQDRALLTGDPEWRDYTVRASVLPVAAQVNEHADRLGKHPALIGLVARAATSRAFYLFGVQAKRRLVLLLRRDDDWRELAGQDIPEPTDYLDLELTSAADALRAACPALGVSFFVTDTTLPAGRCGVRAIGTARVASVAVSATPAAVSRNTRRVQAAAAAVAARAASVPDAVPRREFALAELGGAPVVGDFVVAGRGDLLVCTPTSVRAFTADGAKLWETPLAQPQLPVFAATSEGTAGRLIYLLAGCRGPITPKASVLSVAQSLAVSDELCVLRGSDGAVLARTTLPPMADDVRYPDLSPTSARFSAAGGEIILREWRQSLGGGGSRLWAYNRQLEPLWEREQQGAWYGHHWALALHDVDGDGYDELLAGGELLDRRGRVIWEHEHRGEMAALGGWAGHYDAVALGNLSGEPGLDPTAFLCGGSAGVYVVDARTGRTRAIHRIGHAQGRTLGRFRADLPGTQVLAVTRWGNTGILTLFSGAGDRLWTIQPDWVGQGAAAITWPGQDAQLIWSNTSPDQALYDGHGRRVRALPALRTFYGARMRREVEPLAARLGTDRYDSLCLQAAGRLVCFGPA